MRRGFDYKGTRRTFLQRVQLFGILIVVAVTISKKIKFSSVNFKKVFNLEARNWRLEIT